MAPKTEDNTNPWRPWRLKCSFGKWRQRCLWLQINHRLLPLRHSLHLGGMPPAQNLAWKYKGKCTETQLTPVIVTHKAKWFSWLSDMSPIVRLVDRPNQLICISDVYLTSTKDIAGQFPILRYAADCEAQLICISDLYVKLTQQTNTKNIPGQPPIVRYAHWL